MTDSTTTDLPAAVTTAQAWLKTLPQEQCNRPAPIRPSIVAALIDAYEAEATVRRISTADRTTEVEALKVEVLRAIVAGARSFSSDELVELIRRLGDPS